MSKSKRRSAIKQQRQPVPLPLPSKQLPYPQPEELPPIWKPLG